MHAAFAHAWLRWRELRPAIPGRGCGTRPAGWRRCGTTHHLRRRLDDTGADTELLAALQALPTAPPAAVLLQTLGGLDLPDRRP